MTTLSEDEAKDIIKDMLPIIEKGIKDNGTAIIAIDQLERAFTPIRREGNTPDVYCKIALAAFEKGIATDVGATKHNGMAITFEYAGKNYKKPSPDACKGRWEDVYKFSKSRKMFKITSEESSEKLRSERSLEKLRKEIVAKFEGKNVSLNQLLSEYGSNELVDVSVGQPDSPFDYGGWKEQLQMFNKAGVSDIVLMEVSEAGFADVISLQTSIIRIIVSEPTTELMLFIENLEPDSVDYKKGYIELFFG
jgi:hypothetical protein